MSPARGLLLVEGPHDQQVVYQFCNVHGIENKKHFDVCPPPKPGIDGLLAAIPAHTRSGLRALGLIVDADEQPLSQWRRLRDRLFTEGYRDFPDLPSDAGLVLEARDGLPRLGVWMMPNNLAKGMIEDFLLQHAHAGDTLLTLAREAVARIPAEQVRFKPSYRSKAEIHTWLAWQEEPGTPLGLALPRNYLATNSPLGLALRGWLLRLFQPEANPPQIG